jgi:hypothetical protein
VNGFEALDTTYHSLVDGTAPPDEAYVVTLG